MKNNPKIRSIAARLQELHLEKVPLMLKALLHTIKMTGAQSAPVQQPVQPVIQPTTTVVINNTGFQQAPNQFQPQQQVS